MKRQHLLDVSGCGLTRRIQRAGLDGRVSYRQGFAFRLWGDRAYVWIWRRP